jgi:hypothetical protein
VKNTKSPQQANVNPEVEEEEGEDDETASKWDLYTLK